MISHTAAEKALAAAWQELLCGVFDLSPDEVKFSTDRRGAVNAREEFLEQIKQWIRTSRVVISLQTPVSRSRPWLLWEAGFAQSADKELFVVVYEARNTQAAERIQGKLGSPLDVIQQFQGMRSEDVEKVLRQLKIGALRDVPTRAAADESALIRRYVKAILRHEHRWVKRRFIYETRICLKFSAPARKTLDTQGIIAPTVEVQGVEGSLRIFGFDASTRVIRWDALLKHLLAIEDLPWPGSAARWARGLGRKLQAALHGTLIDGPEGLPLYADARPDVHHSYRPSIVLRDDTGGVTYFIVSFTHMPSVLVAPPQRQRTRVLLHYLDFCRMMRWGVLERNRFQRYFDAPDAFGEDEGQDRLREFIEAIMTIRTDFWNRNLGPNEIDHVIGEKHLPKLHRLTDAYFAAMRKIDPNDAGVAPPKLPDFAKIKSAYGDLTRLNKEYFVLINECFEEELQLLSPELETFPSGNTDEPRP